MSVDVLDRSDPPFRELVRPLRPVEQSHFHKHPSGRAQLSGWTDDIDELPLDQRVRAGIFQLDRFRPKGDSWGDLVRLVVWISVYGGARATDNVFHALSGTVHGASYLSQPLANAATETELVESWVAFANAAQRAYEDEHGVGIKPPSIKRLEKLLGRSNPNPTARNRRARIRLIGRTAGGRFARGPMSGIAVIGVHVALGALGWVELDPTIFIEAAGGAGIVGALQTAMPYAPKFIDDALHFIFKTLCYPFKKGLQGARVLTKHSRRAILRFRLRLALNDIYQLQDDNQNPLISIASRLRTRSREVREMTAKLDKDSKERFVSGPETVDEPDAERKRHLSLDETLVLTTQLLGYKMPANDDPLQRYWVGVADAIKKFVRGDLTDLHVISEEGAAAVIALAVSDFAEQLLKREDKAKFNFEPFIDPTGKRNTVLRISIAEALDLRGLDAHHDGLPIVLKDAQKIIAQSNNYTKNVYQSKQNNLIRQMVDTMVWRDRQPHSTTKWESERPAPVRKPPLRQSKITAFGLLAVIGASSVTSGPVAANTPQHTQNDSRVGQHRVEGVQRPPLTLPPTPAAPKGPGQKQLMDNQLHQRLSTAQKADQIVSIHRNSPAGKALRLQAQLANGLSAACQLNDPRQARELSYTLDYWMRARNVPVGAGKLEDQGRFVAAQVRGWARGEIDQEEVSESVKMLEDAIDSERSAVHHVGGRLD